MGSFKQALQKLLKNESVANPFKTIIAVISIITMLCSCITYSRCIDKFGQYPKNTASIKYDKAIPVKTTIPADSNKAVFNPDTLKKNKIYSNAGKDSTGILLQYWMDEYRKLNIKAKRSQIVVHDTIEIHDTIPCPPVPVLVPKESKTKQYWREYSKYAGVFLPLLLLVIIYMRRK